MVPSSSLRSWIGPEGVDSVDLPPLPPQARLLFPGLFLSRHSPLRCSGYWDLVLSWLSLPLALSLGPLEQVACILHVNLESS